MTWKPIRYSKHAAKRLKLRGIKRGDVRWLLEKGAKQKSEDSSGEQRWVRRGQVGKRSLYVVYIERDFEIEIVTVAEEY